MAHADKKNKLTEKQEAFTLGFFQHGNATQAYRDAYDVDPNSKDSWIHVEACQMLDNPKIALRLKALRDQAEQLAIYSVMQACEEYEEARQLAMAEASPAAAVSAITGKVKLFGLEAATKRKHEITGKDGQPIKTESTGVAKLSALLDAISSRTTGEPT